MQPRATRLTLLGGGVLLLALVAFLLVRPHRDLIAGHAYAIPSGHNRILVEVLNGTARPGLARTATRQLREQGLDVVYFGNDPAGQRDEGDSTRILVRQGSADAGEAVAHALGTGVVKQAADTLRRVDVSVILGPDYVPEPGLHP